MIRIERKKVGREWKYFVNNKEITDELKIPIEQRKLLKDFKKAISEGLLIKSKIYR